jgi:hypothetical protein
MNVTLPKMAISIRQPWAWAIVTPGVNKDIENRDWRTGFRGGVAIHASKGMTRGEYEDCLSTMHAISRSHPFPSGLELPAFDELERGGIVGVAAIVDCVDDSVSPWFFGKWGFVLQNARPVPFIPVKGQLGFFEWRRNLL